MVTLVLIWAGMASPMVPLMAAQCRLATQKTGCHGTQTSPGKHACCHEESVPTPQPSKPLVPMCPMHEQMLPSSCNTTTATSCCALMLRESPSRRLMKPEPKSGDEQFAAQVVVVNASSLLSPRPGPERRVSPGLRYNKPVLNLKADLRI
ncbi:MAG: hypothetical protein ACM3JB_15840 [Acidobacteriaceae bacterium]